MPFVFAKGCLLLWIRCCLTWPVLAVRLLTSRAATMPLVLASWTC